MNYSLTPRNSTVADGENKWGQIYLFSVGPDAADEEGLCLSNGLQEVAERRLQTQAHVHQRSMPSNQHLCCIAAGLHCNMSTRTWTIKVVRNISFRRIFSRICKKNTIKCNKTTNIRCWNKGYKVWVSLQTNQAVFPTAIRHLRYSTYKKIPPPTVVIRKVMCCILNNKTLWT